MNRFIVAAILAMWFSPTSADEFQKDGIVIAKPWARPSIGEVKVGAAYLSITNNGAADDRLLGAKTAVSDAVEVHAHIMNSDVMQMRKVEGVAAPSGATVKFEPGGLHVMLVGLKQKLTEGASFPLTLVFEKAGEIAVDVKIEKGQQQTGSGGHRHH
ncbi:MAG: copper chaperone PCu(A)C [Chitinophagales bacterium]|nr:copper chaperone PCu(A)C [Hyphomicrobiales bacterium]